MTERQPLTDEQNEELEQIFNAIAEHGDKLNEWERGFINDNHQRWEQYGKNNYITEKQWTTLLKIYKKVTEGE